MSLYTTTICTTCIECESVCSIARWIAWWHMMTGVICNLNKFLASMLRSCAQQFDHVDPLYSMAVVSLIRSHSLFYANLWNPCKYWHAPMLFKYKIWALDRALVRTLVLTELDHGPFHYDCVQRKLFLSSLCWWLSFQAGPLLSTSLLAPYQQSWLLSLASRTCTKGTESALF